MPDLTNAELIASLTRAQEYCVCVARGDLGRAVTRLTAAAEVDKALDEEMDLRDHAVARAERAEASLTDTAERERGLRLDVEELSQCREQDTLAATAQWRAAFEAAGRDLLASVEREQRMREALRKISNVSRTGLLTASRDIGDWIDDIVAIGERADAALAAAPEDRAEPVPNIGPVPCMPRLGIAPSNEDAGHAGRGAAQTQEAWLNGPGAEWGGVRNPAWGLGGRVPIAKVAAQPPDADERPPREPNKAMLAAGYKAFGSCLYVGQPPSPLPSDARGWAEAATDIWRAMHDASLARDTP